MTKLDRFKLDESIRLAAAYLQGLEAVIRQIKEIMSKTKKP